MFTFCRRRPKWNASSKLHTTSICAAVRVTAVPATVKASSHNIYMAFQQGTAVVFLTGGDSGAPRQLTAPPTLTGPEDVLTGGGLSKHLCHNTVWPPYVSDGNDVGWYKIRALGTAACCLDLPSFSSFAPLRPALKAPLNSTQRTRYWRGFFREVYRDPVIAGTAPVEVYIWQRL